MTDFFKKRGKSISRVFLSQFAMVAFGIMVLLQFIKTEDIDGVMTAVVPNPALLIGANLLAVAIFFFLLYTMLWEDGSKEIGKYDPVSKKQHSKNGILIVLTANSVNIILTVVFTVMRIAKMIVGDPPVWMDTTIVMCDFLLDLILAMFKGFAVLVSPAGSTHPLVYIIAVASSMAVAYIGYMNGYKDFRILGLFGIKPKEDKNLTR